MTASVPRYLPIYLELESLSVALRKIANQVQGDLLLDIGCGQRPYATLFASVTRYVGIDLPTSGVMSGEPDAWADGMVLPFRSGAFDIVLCTQVLEHAQRPWWLVEESYRVLKAGGFFILTAPQTWGLHEEPRDYYRFTSYGLRYLLERTGFQVKTLEARGGVFRMVGQTLMNFWYIHHQIPRLNVWRKAANILWNSFFSSLDRRWCWEKDTLGYAVLAIRPEGIASARDQ